MSISFDKEIRPLFRDKDENCMSAFGIALRDYAWIADPVGDEVYPSYANANHVLARLVPDAGTGRMPKNGPYWSDEQIALYRQWMADGYAA